MLECQRDLGGATQIPGVSCQERSREELLETLEVTLREALELNRSETVRAAGEGFEKEKIAV